MNFKVFFLRCFKTVFERFLYLGKVIKSHVIDLILVVQAFDDN